MCFKDFSLSSQMSYRCLQNDEDSQNICPPCKPVNSSNIPIPFIIQRSKHLPVSHSLLVNFCKESGWGENMLCLDLRVTSNFYIYLHIFCVKLHSWILDTSLYHSLVSFAHLQTGIYMCSWGYCCISKDFFFWGWCCHSSVSISY